MRIVLDTNVFVSAVISPLGASAELLDRWNDDDYELVTSEEQFDELSEVLVYPRITKRLKPEARQTLLKRLREAALFVTGLPEISLSEDPDDNLILATAVAGKCSMVASGDKKHMLRLNDVAGIPIVTPVRAIELLDARERQQ